MLQPDSAQMLVYRSFVECRFCFSEITSVLLAIASCKLITLQASWNSKSGYARILFVVAIEASQFSRRCETINLLG